MLLLMPVVVLPASDDFTVEIVKEHLIIDLDDDFVIELGDEEEDDFEIELGDEEEDDFEIEIKEVVQEDKWKERVRRSRLKTHIVIGEEPFSYLSTRQTKRDLLVSLTSSSMDEELPRERQTIGT